jgi:hypothetical protein
MMFVLGHIMFDLIWHIKIPTVPSIMLHVQCWLSNTMKSFAGLWISTDHQCRLNSTERVTLPWKLIQTVAGVLSFALFACCRWGEQWRWPRWTWRKPTRGHASRSPSSVTCKGCGSGFAATCAVCVVVPGYPETPPYAAWTEMGGYISGRINWSIPENYNNNKIQNIE